MVRRFRQNRFMPALVLGFVVLAGAPSYAGMLRGAVVSADEQDADPETGVTLARGNAEVTVAKQGIAGRADTIEINPAAKQIRFTGRVSLTVGAERYEGDAVTCSLDFNACTTDATPPATPPSAVTASATAQPMPPPAALGADTAVTSPR